MCSNKRNYLFNILCKLLMMLSWTLNNCSRSCIYTFCPDVYKLLTDELEMFILLARMIVPYSIAK